MKSALSLCCLQLQFAGSGLQCSSDKFSARCRFGNIAWRALNSHALRWPASEAVIVICGFAASDPLLRTRLAAGLLGALKLPGFGFRSSQPQFSVAGFLPA